MANAAGQILTMLRDTGPASRADLARATGLSSAGLTKTTAQLMQQGVLDERQPEDHSGLGRPPVQLSLRAEGRFAIGIHLSPGSAGLVVTDALLNLRAEDGFAFDLAMPVEDLVARIARATSRLIETSGVPHARIVGIGLGLPGGVDRTRRISTHSIFADWSQAPFAALLEKCLALPTILEHNATAIALAEAQFGAGRRSAGMLHVFMGRGIGAGMAQGGRAAGRQGPRGPVEIGHIVLDPEGRACRCGGRGCLETCFSEQPLLDLVGLGAVPPQGLIAAAMASPAWPDLYERFLQALATTVTLLSPDNVVLGGHLHAAPDAFLDDLRRDLPGRLMQQHRQNLTIERIALKGPVGACGAACVGLEEFFYRTGPAHGPTDSPAIGPARIPPARIPPEHIPKNGSVAQIA